MQRTQSLLHLWVISAVLFINTEQARSIKNLRDGRIQGGDAAFEGQFPYQISLEAYRQSLCGGSILSERFVITAAHCVINKNGSFTNYPLKVVGGISDLNMKDDEFRVTIDVEKVYVPKKYVPKDSRLERTTADIAILELKKDLDFDGNPHLDKINLPEKDENYAGETAIISGFGDNEVDLVENPETGEREETNAKNYGKMRFAEAKVLSHEECQKYFPVIKVTEKHLCAAIVQREEKQPEGVCIGDSGGPLVYHGVQMGVVSRSPLGCREDSEPAVYTKVSSYLDFVNKVVDGKIDNSIRSATLKNC